MAFELINREWCPEIEGCREEFIADTEADVNALPKSVAGSSALIASTGDVYIVNASGQWVKFGGEA